MTSKIRAVGNSKGVILPKKYLDQCGIEGQVHIAVKDNTITITAAKKVIKKSWADFKRTGKKEKIILVTNTFDDEDWTW